MYGIGFFRMLVRKNLFKCVKCGYEVTVDRMLQPSEQKCPLCGGLLAYRGHAD